jgi:uncharacterized metal-binding protein
MTNTAPKCAKCSSKVCLLGPGDKGPKFCPMITTPNIFHEAREVAARPEIRKMFRGVARTWKDSGLSKGRIEEVMIYAGNMGFKRLGLAFCIGLADQANVVPALFEKRGFEVVSVCCMTGGFSSDDVGLAEGDRIYTEGRQPQCNPIGQALLMNSHRTELNVLLELCAGDDTLFIKHSQAPVTVLAVKDRVNFHNPLAAIPEYKNSLGLKA